MIHDLSRRCSHDPTLSLFTLHDPLRTIRAIVTYRYLSVVSLIAHLANHKDEPAMPSCCLSCFFELTLFACTCVYVIAIPYTLVRMCTVFRSLLGMHIQFMSDSDGLMSVLEILRLLCTCQSAVQSGTKSCKTGSREEERYCMWKPTRTSAIIVRSRAYSRMELCTNVYLC